MIDKPLRTEPFTLRECLLHAVLLVLVIAVLFPGTFLRGEHTIPGELLYKYEPWSLYKPADALIPPNATSLEPLTQTFFWYAQAKKTLDAGEWPLWNPMQFCGLPLLANFQSAVFYPPRIVHALFDFVTATTLFILLRVWLCGATAYWCGRAIGMGRAGARFLSLGWMLCMYNMVWVYWPVPDTSAWAPVVFLGVERVLQYRYRQGFFAIALGGTLILLAGHPETAFTITLGIGAYFLIRLMLERRWGRRLWIPIAVVSAAWIPALLLCSVQLIPFLEYLVNSFTYATRSASDDAVPTLLFRGLVALWAPRFFGAVVDGNFWGLKEEASATFAGNAVGNTNHVSYVYVGIVTWMALALALSRFRTDRLTRHRCIALLAPGAVGILLALDHPLVSFIHELPLFSSVVLTYYANFMLFALVISGAMGVDAIARGELPMRAIRWPIATLVGIGVFLGASFLVERTSIPSPDVERYVIHQLLLAFAFAVAAMLIAAYALRSRAFALGAVLLAALLAADLLVASRDLRSTSPRERIYAETALFDFLQDLNEDTRFSLNTGGLLPGVSQMYGIEMMSGYDAIVPERFRRFVVNSKGYWGKMEPTVGAKYYVFREGTVDEDSPRYRHLNRVDGFNVVEFTEAFGRAYLVGRLETAPDAAALFRRLAEDSFDPAAVAVTEMPPSEPLPDSASDDVGLAVMTGRTANTVRVEVDAKARCVLVLSDTYFPGWVARVDGVKTELFPVNYAFRGVIVPAGKHVVEYEYRPRSFRVGLAISTFTGVISCLSIAFYLIRKTRRNATP